MSLTKKEEGIVSITSRMLLRLEESIEIPERGFNIVVGRHFFESREWMNIQRWTKEKKIKTYPISKKISFIMVRHLRRVWR